MNCSRCDQTRAEAGWTENKGQKLPQTSNTPQKWHIYIYIFQGAVFGL